MAIKVRYGDAVIEAETAEDLKTVLATLGQLNGLVGVPVVDRLKEYRGRLIGEQSRFLEVLRDAPEGLSEEDACRVLGIDRKRLGGILKALSRKASTAKIDPDKVIVKDIERGVGGVRRYTFRIAPEMKEALS